MNKQLTRTLNSISQQLPKLIRGLELVYNSQATISIERIDRPLLLTQGEIQELSDYITMNPTGLKKEYYVSCYFALYKDKLTAIPTNRKVDFKITERGIDIIEFLIRQQVWHEIEDLQAIIHLDLFKSFEHDPPSEKLHWFKIQVATPKESKSVSDLIQAELDRKQKLVRIQEMRQEMRRL